MNLATATLSHPLREDADGVIRIGGTRVTLQTVIAAFDQGAGVEEIVLRYPVLALEEVYATVSFFLAHEVELREYLSEERDASTETRRESERRPEVIGIRERLRELRKGG